MESAQMDGSSDKEVGEQLAPTGEPESVVSEVKDNAADIDDSKSGDSLSVQKRLKKQERAHARETRELQARISQLESHLQNPGGNNGQAENPYDMPSDDGTGVDEQIRKAVGYALRHKELEERRANEVRKAQENAAYIKKQHDDLHKHLNDMSDKYDDFDDIVKGPQTPYSQDMVTAAMFLPRNGAGSAGEVLYKLGKNPDELKRIAALHPLDQATELVKLSHALISGADGKKDAQQAARPLGQIKSNPVTNSLGITDKTPVSDLRKRMKTGGRYWA